jgi:4-hydroxy-tetrahydrodipicolinate synthase
LSILDLMRPDTRLPIMPLNDVARAEVARAIAAIADEELNDSVGA